VNDWQKNIPLFKEVFLLRQLSRLSGLELVVSPAGNLPDASLSYCFCQVNIMAHKEHGHPISVRFCESGMATCTSVVLLSICPLGIFSLQVCWRCL